MSAHHFTKICQAFFFFLRLSSDELFIGHIHNYTEYNQQWNVFSAFNPSKCTHAWSSGQPTLRHTGSSWKFGALLKGLTSVLDNSCWSRDSNPQPRITSPTLYPLGHDCFMYQWHIHIHIYIYIYIYRERATIKKWTNVPYLTIFLFHIIDILSNFQETFIQ